MDLVGGIVSSTRISYNFKYMLMYGLISDRRGGGGSCTPSSMEHPSSSTRRIKSEKYMLISGLISDMHDLLSVARAAKSADHKSGVTPPAIFENWRASRAPPRN